jgi:hypothetical protein
MGATINTIRVSMSPSDAKQSTQFAQLRALGMLPGKNEHGNKRTETEIYQGRDAVVVLLCCFVCGVLFGPQFSG